MSHPFVCIPVVGVPSAACPQLASMGTLEHLA